MKDRNLTVYKKECRKYNQYYDFRKRAREKLKEAEYYLSKPDQIHSHMFSVKSNKSMHYWRNVEKKDHYEYLVRTVDKWTDQIDRIIEGVPAVSMKYFVWIIWVEQKNYRKVAEQFNENPDWLSRMIRKQLQESIQKSGINVAEMDIFTDISDRQNSRGHRSL